MKTKRVGAVALLLVLVLSLAGCGKSLEKQLPGSWYLEGENEPYFIFYDGGNHIEPSISDYAKKSS